jgi:hypothetical protein
MPPCLRLVFLFFLDSAARTPTLISLCQTATAICLFSDTNSCISHNECARLQGRFVVDDAQLRWLMPLRTQAADTSVPGVIPAAAVSLQRTAMRKSLAHLYVVFACGCLKGALFHLNMACSIVGSCEQEPACVIPLFAHDCVLFERIGLQSMSFMYHHICGMYVALRCVLS